MVVKAREKRRFDDLLFFLRTSCVVLCDKNSSVSGAFDFSLFIYLCIYCVRDCMRVFFFSFFFFLFLSLSLSSLSLSSHPLFSSSESRY
jgi:hypothetical protein